MCRWSGQLGPKVREGDRQAPEGFYDATAAAMNPRSSFFLSSILDTPTLSPEGRLRYFRSYRTGADVDGLGWPICVWYRSDVRGGYFRKASRDEGDVAALIAKGTPAIRLVYQDGGGHP